MKITIEASVGEVIHLIDEFFSGIHQEIETMSGTLEQQLTDAQTQAEATMNDVSAKIDAAIAARPAEGTAITQDHIDRANRLVTIAQTISDKIDAAATDPAAPPAA